MTGIPGDEGERDVNVMEHCDRVVVLALGSVLAGGSPAEIQANPTVRKAYLGEGPSVPRRK
ncbi:hypothetical protein [Frankia gtarii]|uniref:ABC transporter ATP-binding protein C-terminal domain-containing protein n=1 Tax=Frankia gtarii TaxID=2950102 RepID=UPI0021BFB4B1|nr:hypothetical protein [Frankia gtarii]